MIENAFYPIYTAAGQVPPLPPLTLNPYIPALAPPAMTSGLIFLRPIAGKRKSSTQFRHHSTGMAYLKGTRI